MNARGFLYALARFMGDVRAVRRGRLGQRIHNRIIGKYAGRIMGRFWK